MEGGAARRLHLCTCYGSSGATRSGRGPRRGDLCRARGHLPQFTEIAARIIAGIDIKRRLIFQNRGKRVRASTDVISP